MTLDNDEKIKLKKHLVRIKISAKSKEAILMIINSLKKDGFPCVNKSKKNKFSHYPNTDEYVAYVFFHVDSERLLDPFVTIPDGAMYY